MPYEDRAFVYETPLLDLSRVVQAAFVAEMLIAFGILAPGPGVRLPPRHRWPLRWWNATLVTFVTFRSGHGDLSARALLLSPGAARTLRGGVLYLDKLWSAQPRRGAGRTLMNALAMVAEERGAALRWRARDPGFFARWVESHRAWPPAPAPPLARLHDRDYVHMGLQRRRRAWEAEDVLWLRMPSAWAELF
jgi:hypothetical protein